VRSKGKKNKKKKSQFSSGNEGVPFHRKMKSYNDGKANKRSNLSILLIQNPLKKILRDAPLLFQWKKF